MLEKDKVYRTLNQHRWTSSVCYDGKLTALKELGKLTPYLRKKVDSTAIRDLTSVELLLSKVSRKREKRLFNKNTGLR